GGEVKEGRGVAIARLLLRVGPDQPIEIARFELVGVARERGRVADTVIARATLEEIAEGQRRERGVAAGAAAADHAALVVDPALPGQELRAVDAVIDIDHAPGEMQPIAVGPPEAGRAAVVHVEHRDAEAGPVYRAGIEGARRRRGRPA